MPRYLTEYNFENKELADFVLRLYNPYVEWVDNGMQTEQFSRFHQIVESLPAEDFELSLVTELVSSGLWEAFMSGVKMSEGYKAVRTFHDELLKALEFDKKHFRRSLGEAIFIYGEEYGCTIERNAATLSDAFRAYVDAHSPLVRESEAGFYYSDINRLSDLAFARGVCCFAMLYTKMLESRDINKIVREEVGRFDKFSQANTGINMNRQQAFNDCLKWASKSSDNMQLFDAYKPVLVWMRHVGEFPKPVLERFIRQNVKTFGKLYPKLVRDLLLSTKHGDEEFVDKWITLCA